MRDAVIAEYISTEYKTARGRLVGMIVTDQDLHSLLGPKVSIFARNAPGIFTQSAPLVFTHDAPLCRGGYG